MSSGARITILTGPLAVSGPNVAALDLATALVGRGIFVEILAGEGPLRSRFTSRGVEVIEFDLSGSFLADLPRLPELRRAVKEFDPTLLHLADDPIARHGSWLARRCRKPFTLTVTRPAAAGSFLRSPWLHRLLAPSRAVRDELVLSGHVPETRIEVIPAGVDLTRFPDPTEPLAGESAVVGTVTSLDSEAGLDELLEATRILLARGASLHLVIAGRGPRSEPLRRTARDLGIQKHVTLTEVPRDFERILDSFDVFLGPRVREWTGYGILQGMASARPVVAAGAGAVFTILREGETGLVVPTRDAEALADGIMSLLSAPDRAREMGRAGRDSVSETFSAERTVDRIVEILESVRTNAGG